MRAGESEDRLLGAVEREGRIALRRLDIGLVEGRNRPDVGPVSVEQEGRDFYFAQEFGDDLATEVIIGRLEALLEGLTVEDVDAHTGEIPAIIGIEIDGAAHEIGGAEALDDCGIFGFLDKLKDRAILIDAHKPHARGVFAVDEVGGNRQFCIGFAVMSHHLGIIHAIEMVAGKNERFAACEMTNMMKRRADGIRSPLEPVLASFRLFGGKNLHKTTGERIKLIRHHDVTMKACTEKLRQHKDSIDAGIDAV